MNRLSDEQRQQPCKKPTQQNTDYSCHPVVAFFLSIIACSFYALLCHLSGIM